MVLISRVNRNKVYETLLSEGVIVMKEVFCFHIGLQITSPRRNRSAKPASLDDDEILDHQGYGWEDLQLVLSQNLNLFNYFRRFLYFYLKTEGVAYLKEVLGITNENVVPITHKKDRKEHVVGGNDEGQVIEYNSERR